MSDEFQALKATVRLCIEDILRANGEAIPVDLEGMLFNGALNMDDTIGSDLSRWLKCLDRDVRGAIRQEVARIIQVMDFIEHKEGGTP